MFNDREYYENLLSRSACVLSTCDISDTCARFNQKLNKLEPSVKSDVSEWFYALTCIYKSICSSSSSKTLYKPRSIPAGNDTFYLTYELVKIESTILQGILLAYMLDCLNCIN